MIIGKTSKDRRVTSPMTNKQGQGSLSLEQIERDAWGDPPSSATRLIRAAYELHRKPVAALTTEDLRLLIGQQIGVEVLLPYALDLLGKDPLVEGDMYPGDLLVAVLRLPPEYWVAHRDQAAELRRIAGVAKETDSMIQAGIDVIQISVDRFLSMTEQHT